MFVKNVYFLYLPRMTRGKQLEKLANVANLKYAKKKKVCILKVPTPVELTSKGPIIRPSTVDFTGLIQGGQYIAYDAKDTKVKTRFDLKNIHGHQLEYLQTVEELGGIAFFLIRFNSHWEDKAFIVPIEFILHWKNNESRKSIPFEEFDRNWLVPINQYLDKFLT